MTSTENPAAPQPPAQPPSRPQEAAVAPPAKLRRRPQLWALGIALIMLGSLLAAWITTTVSDTRQVLALSTDIDRGQVISEEDLHAVPISGDPSLATVPAEKLEDVVGMRAARDLTADTLLAESAITDETVPAAGETLVGIPLQPGQLPAQLPRPGAEVRIVNTPREQENTPEDGPDLVMDATVVSVTQDETTGLYIVDVTVPTDSSATLASLVATGRVALIVDGD